MAGPTLPDCRLPKLRRHHRATAGQAQTRLERIPVNEAAPDHASHIVSGRTPDLVSVPEKAWQTAVKRFEILKPLLNMGNSERTFAHIKKAARALGKHPATVYRWIENYGRSERLSVFLSQRALGSRYNTACHYSREDH